MNFEQLLTLAVRDIPLIRVLKPNPKSKGKPMPKKATNKAPAKKAVKKAPAKAAKDFNITEAICELLIAAGPKDGNDKIEERFREKYPTIKISKPDFDRERYKAQVQLTRKKP